MKLFIGIGLNRFINIQPDTFYGFDESAVQEQIIAIILGYADPVSLE